MWITAFQDSCLNLCSHFDFKVSNFIPNSVIISITGRIISRYIHSKSLIFYNIYKVSRNYQLTRSIFYKVKLILLAIQFLYVTQSLILANNGVQDTHSLLFRTCHFVVPGFHCSCSHQDTNPLFFTSNLQRVIH